MGKRLQAKFSDINTRILKRPRREKNKPVREEIKFKRKSTTNLDEPLQKVPKIQNEYLREKQSISISDRKKQINSEINNDNVYTEALSNSEDIILKTNDIGHCDLLFSDELRCSFLNFVGKDFYYHILDEISLEGLDGITLEAFWKRFKIAFENLPEITLQIKNFIWKNVISSNRHFQFFELPVARAPLEIYNRFDYMHTDIGIVMELPYELPDIYPPYFVNNPSVLGSCATFNDRVDISGVVTNLTFGEAEERYDRKLVIVANQNLRTYALCGDLADPLIEFLNTEYGILERVGRSRKLGELTQGKMSLASGFKMDPKSVFHYKKQLSNYGLISKQFFYIKSPIFEQNKTGNLLHLPRFYTNIRSRQGVLADQVINLLKAQPDYKMETKKLREILRKHAPGINKLFKSTEFKKIAKLKVYPYRTIHPNASPYEYLTKAHKVEKLVNCYELVNPFINAAAFWKSVDKEDSDDEDDEKEGELSGKLIYNMDCIRNVYYHIHSCGPQGYSAKEIRQLTGFDTNTTRLCLKKLVLKGLVNLTKFDQGKQRIYKYSPKHVKPIDQPTDSESIPTTTTDVKESSIKSEILEKQIAAIENKKQEIAIKPEQIPDHTSSSDNFLKIAKLTTTTTTDVKESSIKSKLLEKQRAAIENKKKEIAIKPEQIPDHKTSSDNFLKIAKPLISQCTWLTHFEVSPVPETTVPVVLHDIATFKKYKIHLTVLSVNTHHAVNINDILNEIQPCITKPTIKENFKDFYVKKYSDKCTECIETTVFLFRVLLGEIDLRKELLNIHNTKEAPMSLPDLSAEVSHNQTGQSKLDYMGTNPVRVLHEIDEKVTVDLIESTTPEKIRLEKEYPNSQKNTERVYKRLQIVLDIVNDMKVVEEMNKLHRLIIEYEAKEGYDKKIDRKSLCRILKRLVEEGYIKIFKLNLYNNAISKTIVFICHPLLEHSNDSIQTSCQQLKWKYFTSVVKKSVKPNVPAVQKTIEDKIGKSPFSQSDVLNSISEMKNLSKSMIKDINRKFNLQIGRLYGVKPKFTRMRIMHEFLFYLVYNYNGFQNPMPQSDILQLFKSYRIDVSDSDIKEIPNVYANEISWKMFVPPLPIHAGWPNGWTLVCDIILRLPVSVLLRIHNCTFEDSELLDILNHPVKRFYLVKDLSEKVRKTILIKRKYLFAAYETIYYLVLCGLVQFGPQKYKEKDQVFIYLNRRTTLLDTTNSAPGYNEVEEKDYTSVPFYFSTQRDVESYWNTLNTISLNTKLNSREPGKLVTLTYINSKPEIVQCIKSRTPAEAEKYDDGRVPGDKKGASGLDSSLWCHLLRNWFWTTKGGTSQCTGLTNETLKEKPLSNISFKDLRTTSANSKFFLPIEVQKKSKPKKLQRKVLVEKKRISPRYSIYTRTITKRILKKAKRVYCDEIDKKIMKKLGATRVKWSEEEDEFILLCKVGDMVLGSSRAYRKQVVPFTVMRDVLHRMSPTSKYKTSRSIQRRWNKMSKTSYVGLEDQISNIFRIKSIRDTFGALVNKIGTLDMKTGKPFRMTDPQISSAFIILMSYIFHSRKTVIDALHGNLVNANHLSEENLKYTEENAVEMDKREKKYSDPDTDVDIKRDIVKSVIHSSLCATGVTKLSHQLLKIYQNYSDTLIKEAVKELRDTNTITYRRWKDRDAKVWETPFALSQYYIFFQYSTFNNATAEEAYITFLNIVRDHASEIKGNEVTVRNKRYGQLIGVNEIFTFYPDIGMTFYLPQNTVVLNPDIDNYDELVNELAIRYQLKLKALQEGQELEIDIEGENDDYRSKSNDQEFISLDEEQVKPDSQDIPLDFTVDSGNTDTINRLKTWITDCMQTENERRSPSPEFMSKSNEFFENEMDTQKLWTTYDRISVIENKDSDAEFKQASCNEKSVGLIPTLDEIKEGMLKTSDERDIPHITELSDLLKENFNDLKMDLDTLGRLKRHFITEYASLDRLVVDDPEHLQNHDMVQYLDNSLKSQNTWKKIENDYIIRDFLSLPNYEELIRRNGGKDEDIRLASEIIQFAANKQVLGVTGQELKDVFLWREENCSLVQLMKCLLDAGILLQMGIVTLTFVHYNYLHAWVVQQENLLPDATTAGTAPVPSNTNKKVGVRIMPWVRVNGSMDKSALKLWMCNILSYSLDFPRVTFGKLCEKFCYIKPVDLFYITQILEELGCIDLLIYDVKEETLFSEWSPPRERYANFLDNINDINIQPHSVSMTRLGSFFHA